MIMHKRSTQGVAIVPDANNDVSGIGALSCSSLTVNGSSVSSPPSYVVGVVPGTAANNKVLVLGASGEIGTISSLTASNIMGTLQTAAQPNITSLGALSGLTVAGNLSFSGASRSITGLSSISATTLTGALSTASQPNITSLGTLTGLSSSGQVVISAAIPSSNPTSGTLVIAGGLGLGGSAFLSGSLTVNGLITGLLSTSSAAQTNITSLGTLTNLTLSTEGTGLQIPGLKFYDSTTATYKTFNQNYYLDITLGGAVASKALVVDANKDIGSIRTLNAQNLNALVSYQVNGVAFIDAIRNISAASLSTTGDITCSGSLNGFLAYGNQSAITSVGSLTELGIRSVPTNEFFSITGNGTDNLDGSYTRMMTLTGSNLSPVRFQIEVHNGTNATAANATWIGVGTTSPSAPLHITGSNNFVFGAGGTTVYRLRTDNGATESALGPITYSVAGIFSGYIGCTAMAMTSDRRLKRNIQSCPIDRVKRLYESCEVKLYEWNESENRQGQEVGLIAQDLVSAHLTDLISVFYRDDIQEGDDPTLEPAKTQLNVDYSRISAYNMKMIQHMMSEIGDLKRQIDELRSIISE
ncbi:unnamed protein product [Phytophthora lilii]|uniref:Unnamed protein product n=1 Tax=Phytophthora lilii TaxID=2077276 RepID=A0A9W6X727_9STRA|nr:unnamed protein product [Phytophthora lilii]